MLKRILAILLVTSLVLSLVSCSGETQKSKETNKLSIVTTIFPLYDFAKNVAKDLADVEFLIKPGSSSHDFVSNISLKDYSLINYSDIFIYCGGETDEWIEKNDQLQFDKMNMIKTMDLVETYEEEYVEGMERDDHSHKDEEEHSDEEEHKDEETNENDNINNEEHTEDEHVWMNPQNAVIIVQEIKNTLSKIDPKNSDTYEKNANDYILSLNDLDKDFDNVVRNAKRKEIVVADRFPFRYLTQRYGISYSAAFAGCSTQSEASLSTIRFLIDKVNDNSIPVVFYADGSTKTVANQVVNETKATLKLFHSCHDITREEFNNNASYISLMQQNLKNLKEALNWWLW